MILLVLHADVSMTISPTPGSGSVEFAWTVDEDLCNYGQSFTAEYTNADGDVVTTPNAVSPITVVDNVCHPYNFVLKALDSNNQVRGTQTSSGTSLVAGKSSFFYREYHMKHRYSHLPS